jgi:hypothetical protein
MRSCANPCTAEKKKRKEKRRRKEKKKVLTVFGLGT